MLDYELRDLDDGINKERPWENQIVALGGANYRPNVAMLNDDGKEVPGTKGYNDQYVLLGMNVYPSRSNNFGCAKELSCVHELFQSHKTAKE
ncbi:hypothetical protein K438DRAFT_1987194 [Mycena galopus ATCC 62051]|nr:hypothetical protein K438DRAFT_1987194 [Mycena galopus ATCC 62051]